MEIPPRTRKLFGVAVTGMIVLISLAMLVSNIQTPAEKGGAQLSRDAILNHLNAVITWYRDSTTKVQSVGLPSDAIYEDNAQSLAAEAVHCQCRATGRYRC